MSHVRMCGGTTSTGVTSFGTSGTFRRQVTPTKTPKLDSTMKQDTEKVCEHQVKPYSILIEPWLSGLQVEEGPVQNISTLKPYVEEPQMKPQTRNLKP